MQVCYLCQLSSALPHIDNFVLLMIAGNIPLCLHLGEQNVIVFALLGPEGASSELFKTSARAHQFIWCPVAKTRILSNTAVRTCNSVSSSRTRKSAQEKRGLITALRFNKCSVTQCRDMLNILGHDSSPRLPVVHTKSSEACLLRLSRINWADPNFHFSSHRRMKAFKFITA